MAVVLSNLLLEDDAISTAQTLYGLIDDLTPYYQNLTSTIPDRPRQLMDTLIRLGENKSQSEIAKYLGTSQNSVSRHFMWLINNGYIIGKKRSDSKHFRYYLLDRIYVLFYQGREIFHGQNYTSIWLLSDFLVSFYQEDELMERAVKHLSDAPSAAAFDFNRIGLKQYFLLDKEAEAWKTLETYEVPKEKVFKQFGDAIFYTEKRTNRAKAFELGNKILHELKERKIDLNYPMALSMFFSSLLNMKTSNPLFQELCESALKIYTNPHEQVILSAALRTADCRRKRSRIFGTIIS